VIEGVASVNEAPSPANPRPVIRESAATARPSPAARGPVRLDQGRITAAGRDLPRPHDRAGRGRRAPEDAERDRAQRPALRPDADLRDGRRDHPGFAAYAGGVVPVVVLVALFVTLIPTTIGGAALGHRHRRHGPAGALQRARHVRPRRRGGRATSTRCCSTRPARSRFGNRRRPSSCRCRRVTEKNWRMRRSWRACRRDAGGPLDRRAGQGKIRHARRATWPSSSRHGVPFTAQTRMSGVDFDGATIRKGAVDAVLKLRQARDRQPARPPRRSPAAVDEVAKRRAARRSRWPRWPPARRRPPQGRREGRHQGALRRTAPHGHPHRDDHRRQPDDRGRDRGRSRGRRLPRRGDARGQAAR
jgi:hypothetical protein